MRIESIEIRWELKFLCFRSLKLRILLSLLSNELFPSELKFQPSALIPNVTTRLFDPCKSILIYLNIKYRSPSAGKADCLKEIKTSEYKHKLSFH